MQLQQTTLLEGAPTPGSKTTAGPFLRFQNLLGPDLSEWRGSLLYLTRQQQTYNVHAQPNEALQPTVLPPINTTKANVTATAASPPSPINDTIPTKTGGTSPQQQHPLVHLDTDPERNSNRTELKPVLMDTILGWSFWRFEINIDLVEYQRPIEYSVKWEGGEVDGKFWVPAIGEPMHWAYTSCNGMSLDVPEDSYTRKDPTYLWRDMLQVHSQFPLHCCVGGGDQLYNDGVWKYCGSLQDYGSMKEKQKSEAPWTPTHQSQTTQYYLYNYIDSFTTPDVATAYASIPTVMMYDDHDIFDGYGSYTPELQASPIFEGLFAVAKRFYLLFQQHTTVEIEDRLVDEFLNNTQGYHSLKFLGPQIGLLCIDMRTQRSKEKIVPEATYDLLETACMRMPPTVKHLVVLSGVPVIFPSIPGAESILGGIVSAVKTFQFARKLAKATGILDRFGQPEILDDLTDGWVASVHRDERKKLINMLQHIAMAKRVRVSLLSGDAHVAGIGRFYSRPKQDPRHDPFYMPQIISSAIMNAPPPFAVVRMLMRTNFASNVNDHTRQKMQKAFWPYHPRTDKLLALRNWCDVSAIMPPYAPPMNPEDPEFGGLRFVLRAEHPKRRKSYAEEKYVVEVPRFPDTIISKDGYRHIEASPVGGNTTGIVSSSGTSGNEPGSVGNTVVSGGIGSTGAGYVRDEEENKVVDVEDVTMLCCG